MGLEQVKERKLGEYMEDYGTKVKERKKGWREEGAEEGEEKK
jgi:hypothetical protein